jgi:hypothetical protein
MATAAKPFCAWRPSKRTREQEQGASPSLASDSVPPKTRHKAALGSTTSEANERYLAEEIPERHSTASRCQSWLKNYIKPKWSKSPLNQLKPLLVEDWLKKLDLAPKSRSHLKNLMRLLFNAAMR